MQIRHADAQVAGDRPVSALPLASLTFLCSLGTGVLWNAIFFIAKGEYGFSERDSLLLAFVNGVLYTLMAMGAGRFVRLVGGLLSPRGALALVLLAQALLSPLVAIFPGRPTLWFVAVTLSALGALQWPIVQAFLTSGRHGPAMRSAIGWFNASWMSATAIGLALTGPLERLHLMQWAIPSLLPINLAALGFLAFFPKSPPHHSADEAARHVPASYHPLLAASRVLHPMGYLVIGALAPVLPYLFSRLGTTAALQAPVGSTWHVARLIAVLILWQTTFWHGRATMLVVAAILLAGGFGVAVAAPNEQALLLGLAALGAGQGVIYYSAIYYGLAIGSAEVEAGGIHEALVGAGYFVGPGIGLVVGALGGGPTTFIGAVLGALAVGSALALWRGGRARIHSIA